MDNGTKEAVLKKRQLLWQGFNDMVFLGYSKEVSLIGGEPKFSLVRSFFLQGNSAKKNIQ